MDANLISQIQRQRPFGRLTPRRIYPLPFERIQPVIRIAHRQPGELQIAERIIFDHELVLMLAGQGEFVFGRERVTFGPHDLVVIPPFVPHRIESVKGRAGEHLAVHFDFAPDLPPRQPGLPNRSPYEVRLPRGLQLPRRVRLVAHDRLEEDLQRLLAGWETGDDLGRLEARARLSRVLVAILRRQSAATQPAGEARDRVRIERALALLDTEPARAWPPAELAKAVGLSASHFNRLFREWTGFSPAEYQRRQRVSRARAWLADVRLSVKEVAARAGFDDPYHFSRVFRQLDGLSPTQYRAAVSAGRRARSDRPA